MPRAFIAIIGIEESPHLQMARRSVSTPKMMTKEHTLFLCYVMGAARKFSWYGTVIPDDGSR